MSEVIRGLLQIPSLTYSEINRFWERVEKGKESECWVIDGFKDRDGYGFFKLRGKRYIAHRVAGFLRFGEIVNKNLVCHHCDNPPCCNPKHLFYGSNQDNLADMALKKRSTIGEKHPSHKITETDILAIRKRHKNGETQTRISEDYPISQVQVGHIVREEHWRF